MRSILAIISLLLLSTSLNAQYAGKVFHDLNQNGLLDSNESGLPNILVSDGLNVIPTSADGAFSLPGKKDTRFIFITTPNGYQANRFFLKTEAHQGPYHFPLIKTTPKHTFSFIHITDTETATNKSGWVEILQSYIQHEKPAFLIHTGDICYEDGMKFHAQNVNTATMGVPTYYCIGNHDLVEGKYGEELYEELFGPGWYSFEVSNTHFIVTPMLSGDFKPSYTKKEVYSWLKNLLTHLDKKQPKFVFNHDLLTGEDEFIYGINEKEFINLNEHNLKAWVYGHWHNSFYRPHGNSGIVSICTGVAQRGGIDHSLSQFRVFDVQPHGDFTTELVQTYVDHHLTIVSPAPTTLIQDNQLPILVNAYNSTAKTKAVQYNLNGARWKPLQQQTNWTWTGQEKLDDTILTEETFTISVQGTFNDGETKTRDRTFVLRPKPRLNKADDYWPNFLMNAQHHPGKVKGPKAPLLLEWVTNAGANTYMCAPVVAEGKIFLATYDNGDARNCFLLAYDYENGALLWKFRTDNSVKGAIAYANGHLFATDMAGHVYAVNAKTGALAWKTSLDMPVLPGYVSGTVAHEGKVYAGDGKSFCALNQQDGTKVWCNEEWNSGVGGPPSPTIGKNIIVASSNWNAMYGHDLKTGRLLWKKSESGLRFRDAAPVFFQDTLFVGTQKSLLAMDIYTGDILQKQEMEMGLNTNSTPLIFEDLIVLGTGTNGVAAFHRHDFRLAWTFETGPALSTSTPYSEPVQRTVEASPVMINNDQIFLGASDGFFYCLDARSGELVWKMEVGAPIFASVAVTQNRIFLTDIAGNLYSFIEE